MAFVFSEFTSIIEDQIEKNMKKKTENEMETSQI